MLKNIIEGKASTGNTNEGLKNVVNLDREEIKRQIVYLIRHF